MRQTFQHYAEHLAIEPWDKVLCKNLQKTLNEIAGKIIFTDEEVKSYTSSYNLDSDFSED